MRYDKANGAWINSMLRQKVFQDKNISTLELEEKIGLSIKELVMCWLFESRNNFKVAISEWKQSGAPMVYQEIQGY